MSEKDITAGFAKKVNIRRLVLLRFNRTCAEAGDADTNGDTWERWHREPTDYLLLGHYSKHLFHHLTSGLLFLGNH